MRTTPIGPRFGCSGRFRFFHTFLTPFFSTLLISFCGKQFGAQHFPVDILQNAGRTL